MNVLRAQLVFSSSIVLPGIFCPFKPTLLCYLNFSSFTRVHYSHDHQRGPHCSCNYRLYDIANLILSYFY